MKIQIEGMVYEISARLHSDSFATFLVDGMKIKLTMSFGNAQALHNACVDNTIVRVSWANGDIQTIEYSSETLDDDQVFATPLSKKQITESDNARLEYMDLLTKKSSVSDVFAIPVNNYCDWVTYWKNEPDFVVRSWLMHEEIKRCVVLIVEEVNTPDMAKRIRNPIWT